MTDAAFNCMLQRLNDELMHHPHKDELLNLMEEQLRDDTFELVTETL